jgi:mono/diheme cytochrome c family protein
MKTSDRSLRAAIFMALAMVAFVVLGVSSALVQVENLAAATNKKWNYAELAKVPVKLRVKRNPFESDPDAAAAGGKLFEQHCAECHGRKGEGGRKGPSLLRTEVQQASPGALYWILTNGVVRRGMPVWSKLPEPQRWQIVTFLESFGTTAGPQPPTAPE